ncbi:MAG: cation-transporting P-type ATPase, partial [Desulfatiglandaceae bacterium]
DQVLDALEVEGTQGLTEGEVRRRLQQQGPNKLQEAQRHSVWEIAVEQFKSMVIMVLVLAGAVAFSFQHWVEGIAIVAVLVVNAAIGFTTEWKALQSMEALRKMGGDAIRVRRDGADREINAEKLVPGDIIIVEAGDMVPADSRLIESNNLRVSEAALTGESVPVRKGIETVSEDAPLAEQYPILFKGTTITEGSGEAVVVHTGMETELGRISALAESAEKEATPLQKRLDLLGRRLAWITIGIAVLIAGVGLLAGQETRKMIETAIALGVAAIPEGLPIVATIALARGMHLMAQRHVLIKKLPAVETLGATQIIFTDKTGTLTENRMTVSHVSTATANFEVYEEDGRVDGDGGAENPVLRHIIQAGVLCNNASLQDRDHDRIPEQEQGDPTEVALLRVGFMLDLKRDELLDEMPEEREVAFDADLMMMATYHQGEEGLTVAVKGAPEAVLDVCDSIAQDEQKDSPMDDDTRRNWIDRSDVLAGQGLRVLAFADKTVDGIQEKPYVNLRFLGICGLLDPPRGDVGQAVDECRKAGIRVVMVTGDKPGTAVAIARQTGIADEKQVEVLPGSDLTDPDRMSDAQRQRIAGARVFARVSPEQKLHLVKLAQSGGQTVAMTGDGVNDAPALKKADIGVAMGQRGTDVARQAADMVLQDDAFPSIVAAVRQGRIIFGNIRQSVMFMLCTNVAEVIAVAVAAAAGGFSKLPIPLLPLQILYLNVITDVFPALALGMGRGEADVMKRNPRPRHESILTQAHWAAVGGWAALMAVCVLTSLSIAVYGMGFGHKQAVTVSFLTLAFGKLWFVLNLRSPGSTLLHNEITRNPYVGGSIVFCIALLLAAVYVPGLSHLLRTQAPGPHGWAVVVGMSLVPFLGGQILRMVQENTKLKT